MTGLEKVGAAGVGAAVASMTQVTLGTVSTLFGLGWTIVGAVLGVGITWGATRQRLTALEKHQENLASKESVDALHEKIDTIVKMLDSRIIDRRDTGR